MAAATLSIDQALEELQRVAPEAPFLALGQTVFWDEPMKGGLALLSRRLGYSRRFVAGVHDTDYFAKLPGKEHALGKYATVAHNDTSTRGLWSAAGEFSTLFGSETVVTRDTLQHAGLRLSALRRVRPGILDEATEAWGWRGIVSLEESPPISAEVPLNGLFPELQKTFDWALEGSLECLRGEGRDIARKLADNLREIICDESEGEDLTLGGFYKRLLPRFYEFCANSALDLDVTSTTELLRFNSETCHSPRFDLLRPFVEPETRPQACEAYDAAVQGSGIYGVDSFGLGAVPFDVVIPGKGRGTLRIAPKALVIMTPEPQFVTLKRPVMTMLDLANALEGKFGPNCALVGKAVTLIGMLAREFVFVFHEGASSYVKHSRVLHRKLDEIGHPLTLNPILRVRYNAWDAMQVCCSWISLPEPFRRPFGTEELCAPSFAGRWRGVAAEQEELLDRLSNLRRPIDLIRFLDQSLGGNWNFLAKEYDALHAKLEELERELSKVKQGRITLYGELRELKAQRVEAEREKGEHWRATHFEKSPSAEDQKERQRLTLSAEQAIHEITAAESRMLALRKTQDELVSDPEIQRVHERRRSIELEAELKRLRLIRSAVISSKGLEHANFRPSAWWFRLVCPDGLWFRETVNNAEYYLEPLS